MMDDCLCRFVLYIYLPELPKPICVLRSKLVNLSKFSANRKYTPVLFEIKLAPLY